MVDRRFDEIYQLAADMGGAGYIFTGEHDADVMHNSATINLNILQAAHARNNKRIFYSSSACMYPEYNQLDPDNPNCAESSSLSCRSRQRIRLGEAFQRAALFGLCAAIMEWKCASRATTTSSGRKAAGTMARRKPRRPYAAKLRWRPDGGEVEIWGDGKQTRSFLYIDECLEGTLRLMRSNFAGPVNIGSDEMVTIDRLVDIVAGIAGKSVRKRHIEGPTGVRGRNSDNHLIREKLGWSPSTVLVDGLRPTYEWIRRQVMRNVPTKGHGASSLRSHVKRN